MPSAEVLATWTTVKQAAEWVCVSDDEWIRLATAMGDRELSSLLLLSAIDDDGFVEARNEAKFTIVRKAAVNLMFAAIKTKFSVTTKITPTSKPAPTAAAAPQAEGAAATLQPHRVTATGTVRVNLGQVINQALNQEIPVLLEAEIRTFRDRYVTVEGDEPIEQGDVSDA